MIEFFFDCSSPWTWLAFRNLQPLAAELAAAYARWEALEARQGTPGATRDRTTSP